MNIILDREEISQIELIAGLYNPAIVKVRRDRFGYPDVLVEAEDHSGFPFRGWWKEGESVADIRWETPDEGGRWPEDVR